MKLTLSRTCLIAGQVVLCQKYWWFTKAFTDEVSFDGEHLPTNIHEYTCGFSALRPAISWRDEK